MTVESPTSPRSSPPPGAERERKKGPLVFLDYDQAELDAAYDQAVYQPNIQQLRDRWVTNSERARARIGLPLRRAYGPGEIEGLDIFPTAAPAPAPVFVFIHGGAWRGARAATSAPPAAKF